MKSEQKYDTIISIGELFDDKAHIIYVNNEIQDDTPLGLLMRDFVCKNADDMHYDVLAKRVRNYKEDEGGLTSMCRAMEEMRAEAEARGKAEGIAEGKAEGIEKMIELLRESGVDEAALQAAAERATQSA